MENNQTSKSNKNQVQKNNRPPKRTNKNNNKEYEYNSYNSYVLFPSMFGGLNVLDYYTPEQLVGVVTNPMANNKVLRELSLTLYGTNGVFTNTVDYMTAMPTLDKVIIPHGKNKDKKKRNKELMESTLRKIKDKEFVRDALFKGMIEGIAFYYFETVSKPKSNKKFMSDQEVESTVEINDIGINASIISLPADYTRIVGKRNMDYVIAFDLDYFTNADGEAIENKLRKYPKEIRDAYYAKNKSGSANGNWVVLNPDKTIVHKIRSKAEEPYGRPLVLAAINDILYGDYFTKTKRGVLQEINNRLIVQYFPGSKERGISALTKQQQQAQHDAVKGAVQNKNNRGGISFVSVAADTKLEALKLADVDIFDDKYESNLNDKISLDMGIAASLLNGSGSGTYSSQISNLELVTSQIFQWVEQIQSELNKCIAANIIQDDKNWVECKYLPITHVNKQEMVNNARQLYLEGRGSLSMWAASCGLAPDVFFALLDQELEMDVDKYPIHQTAYTQSGKEGGRPQADNPTDNTVRSNSNNGNDLPSPSDK